MGWIRSFCSSDKGGTSSFLWSTGLRQGRPALFCQGLCFPQLSLLSEAAFLPLLIKTGKKNNYHFSRLKARKEICPSWELSGWRLRGTSPAAGSTAGTEHLSTGVSTSTKNVPEAHLEGQTQGGRGPSHPAAHLAQEQTDGCEAAQGPPPAQPRANSQCECAAGALATL